MKRFFSWKEIPKANLRWILDQSIMPNMLHLVPFLGTFLRREGNTWRIWRKMMFAGYAMMPLKPLGRYPSLEHAARLHFAKHACLNIWDELAMNSKFAQYASMLLTMVLSNAIISTFLSGSTEQRNSDKKWSEIKATGSLNSKWQDTKVILSERRYHRIVINSKKRTLQLIQTISKWKLYGWRLSVISFWISGIMGSVLD